MDLIIRLEIIVRIVLAGLLVVTPIIWLINGYAEEIKQARQDMKLGLLDFLQQAKAAAQVDMPSKKEKQSKPSEQRDTPTHENENVPVETSLVDEILVEEISEENTQEEQVLAEEETQAPETPTQEEIITTPSEKIQSEQQIHEEYTHIPEQESKKIIHTYDSSEDEKQPNS